MRRKCLDNLNTPTADSTLISADNLMGPHAASAGLMRPTSGNGTQVMDPSIKDVPVTEIGTFSEIAAACCQHDPLRRPRMREARR